jgi:beta-glucosidase
LPVSYPRYTGDILPYDHGVLAAIQQLTPGRITYDGYKPQWPFGFGLSYTEFSYGEPRLSSTTMRAGEAVEVSIEVRNTGDRAGDHIVELYVSDRFASLSPAVRKLRDFTRIHLEAGAAQTVSFRLDERDLEFVNSDLKRVVEPGEFKLSIADQEATFSYE